ncbi:uncharacterized protein LOC111798369 isoform X2 [Cucurbita pepo subsp. pepo]|uniref:uncharacterized protein LOC111798369 isoform X2 n=1 Tax=Cucurbita pepo subsp. pepo TaxID=3664 RepID=UPI000C9D5AC2|nr:uncharacterized protein LOC111798369 isoform X2 [Cucurbita pepo subsp. pepo]
MAIAKSTASTERGRGYETLGNSSLRFDRCLCHHSCLICGELLIGYTLRSKSSWSGGNGRSFRSSFQEDAWKRYNRRLQEEYEEEMERVERIRRMQNVFNRERNKYKRGYESWRENDPGAYHQHHQRDDWYWKAETFYREQQSNNHRGTPRVRTSYLLSHHYTVLGLDRCRKTPYTDAEIKTAFQSKAKQFHPDQNQDNKEAAEAKFKEVMTSYDAIKLERKSSRA